MKKAILFCVETPTYLIPGLACIGYSSPLEFQVGIFFLCLDCLRDLLVCQCWISFKKFPHQLCTSRITIQSISGLLHEALPPGTGGATPGRSDRFYVSFLVFVLAAFLNVVSHHHLSLHAWPLGLWIYHGLHTHHLRTNTIFFQLWFQKIEKLLKNQQNSVNFLFAVWVC